MFVDGVGVVRLVMVRNLENDVRVRKAALLYDDGVGEKQKRRQEATGGKTRRVVE